MVAAARTTARAAGATISIAVATKIVLEDTSRLRYLEAKIYALLILYGVDCTTTSIVASLNFR